MEGLRAKGKCRGRQFFFLSLSNSKSRYCSSLVREKIASWEMVTPELV
jgi:hypothetical protein